VSESLPDPPAVPEWPPAPHDARGHAVRREARTLVRMAERAMIRASDSQQHTGNAARLLVDGPMTFDAWLEAIAGAERWIHFENYIFRDDRIGRIVRDALAERAAAGVRVRVIYDWMGCWATPLRYWRPLRAAGAEVRAFSPPLIANPLDFIRRDHRKMVAVDGRYASVTGLCVGDEWAGDPGAGIPPWRDTGVDFMGPVAAAIDRAFSRTWSAAGAPLPPDEIPDPADVPHVGDVAVRVVEGEPGRSRIYRLSQFVSVGVERRLWITDPYFVLPPAMTEALASAARDGVDVRVLAPAYNNWPIVGGMSRAGYRPLLEAGVRLFEWEGPMIHAKTTVADGIWSRIGSTNLNLASLLGNWELDVAVTDRGFAAAMEELFLSDLEASVEIALKQPRFGTGLQRERRGTERVMVEDPLDEAKPKRLSAREARRRSHRGGRFGRLLGRLARAGSVLFRSLVGERMIGREDMGWISAWAVILFGVSLVGIARPRLLAWPVAAFAFWLGVATVVRILTRPKSG
jgi:cardiolipin synthase A/B